MEKVIREDGGSSCNGLRRQASRLMEPCSSRKALSIRAARASMLSACVTPNPQHPRWLFPRAQVRGTDERRFRILLPNHAYSFSGRL